jgi:hypothetical protein
VGNWFLYSAKNQNGRYEFIDGAGHSVEKTPRYKVGETLYLKEPYAALPAVEPERVEYKFARQRSGANGENFKWQNKLFMPERYARYFIEITGVRVERLQDISEEDCFKEGIAELFNAYEGWVHYDWLFRCPPACTWYYTPRKAYAALIDKVDGEGTWAKNPYVFVYDFLLAKK